MIRVLYVARHVRPTRERQIAHLAAQPDLLVRLVRPVDTLATGFGSPAVALRGRHTAKLVPLVWGDSEDPHRTVYGTWDFGLCRQPVDIIHAEEEPDSLAAVQLAVARRLFAPNASLILHASQNVNRPRPLHVRVVLRLALAAADAVLCTNAAGPGVLAELGYRGCVRVIPPQGVDTTVFRPGLPSLECSSSFTVLYVGRLIAWKSVDTLIEAVARVEADVRLEIVGDGPEAGAWQCLAARLGVDHRVAFLPAEPHERLAVRMGRADTLVLPSRSTPVLREQFGRVLIEAMACGLSVVGSSSGAIPEVIGDAGLIFPEGDTVALAHHLTSLRRSVALRRHLAEKGRARVEALFTHEVIARRTAAFYRGFRNSRRTERLASAGHPNFRARS